MEQSDAPERRSTQFGAPRPVPAHAVRSPAEPEPEFAGTITGLRAVLGEALQVGVRLAAEGQDESSIGDWLKDRLPFLERQFPEYLGTQAPERPLTLGALRSAAEMGYAARLALVAAEREEDLPPRAPDYFMGATNPPDPAWVAYIADELVETFQMGLDMEGLDLPLDDEILERGAARKRFSAIDDDGAHRIRSSWIRLSGTRDLYQLAVTRRGAEITVERRMVGAEAFTPVSGPLTLADIRFVNEAYAEILRELGLPHEEP